MPSKTTKPAAPAKDETPSTNDYAESWFKENAKDLFNHIVPLNRFITSGSLTIDQYIKARSGGVLRLCAKTPELGKSSQGMLYLANYMAVMPKSKAVYFMAEGRLSPELRERTGLKFVWDPKDWDYGTVLVVATNVFELVADFIVKHSEIMFDAGEHLAIMLDSLDGLILKGDKETKGISDGKVAGVPKLTKLLFRHIALPIAFYDIFLIITSQYTTDIKIDQYASSIPRLGEAGGGSSVPHQCDYILEYQPRYKSDYILEDPSAQPDPIKNKIVGLWVNIIIKKSATDSTGTKIAVPIKKGRVGSAIWVEKEVGDFLIAWECYKKNGSWLTLQSDNVVVKEAAAAGVQLKDKIQGLNSLYEYIETEKPVFEWLLAKFRAQLGGET